MKLSTEQIGQILDKNLEEQFTEKDRYRPTAFSLNQFIRNHCDILDRITNKAKLDLLLLPTEESVGFVYANSTNFETVEEGIDLILQTRFPTDYWERQLVRMAIALENTTKRHHAFAVTGFSRSDDRYTFTFDEVRTRGYDPRPIFIPIEGFGQEDVPVRKENAILSSFGEGADGEGWFV